MADQPELSVHVEADETDGGFVASMPARPGVVGQGETPAEALADLAGAIVLADQTSAGPAELSTDEKLDELEATVQRILTPTTQATIEDVIFLLGNAVGLTRILRAERDEARDTPATVYVALIEDRHADPEPVVFTTAADAITYARSCAQEYARTPGDYEERPVKGWLFNASYSPESDKVSVTEKTVHVSLDSAM